MDLNWYRTLNKPAFTPPSGAFAPVWAVMYLLILFSYLTFLRTPSQESKASANIMFFTQLVLNLLWSPVFFGMHNIELSFAIICLLFISIVLTIIFFYRISKLSGLLLIPYLIWVSYAIYLNYGFMVLN